MIFKRGVFLIVLLFCLLSAAGSQIDGDGTIVDYTKILYNARYFGMGGAGVASGYDSGVVLMNPAQLGRMQGWEMSSTQTKIAGEFTYTYLNYVIPLEKEGFGLSYTYVDPGQIFSSTGVDVYGHPVIGDQINANSQVLCLSYGTATIWDQFFTGITLKSVRKTLGEVEGSGNSVDLGLVWMITPKVLFGLNAKNAFQSGFTYSNTDELTEVYDPVYVAGLSSRFFDDNMLLSVDYSIESISKLKLGIEYSYEKTIMFRGGIMDGSMTMGLGFRYDMLQVDFGYKFNEFPLENQAYVSMTYGNAEEKELTRPEIELVEQEGGIRE